jgi:flagellar motor component MotA
MRIIGLIVYLFAALMVGIGSNLPAMIDTSSLIIVLLGTLGLLLFGGSRLGNMFGVVFSGEATVADLQEAAQAWKQAGAYMMTCGGIGTFIGLIIMLKNMDDPAAIAPGMAIALLTTFYGIVLGLGICLPLSARLEDRARPQEEETRTSNI